MGSKHKQPDLKYACQGSKLHDERETRDISGDKLTMVIELVLEYQMAHSIGTWLKLQLNFANHSASIQFFKLC